MSFLRGFSWNVVCTGLVTGLSLLNQSLLFRGLGTEGRGYLGELSTTVMFAGLLFGEWLNRGNTYVVGKQRSRQGILGNTLVYSAGLGGLLLLATWLSPWSLTYLTPLQHYLLAGLILFTVAQKAGQAIVLGEDRLVLYAWLPVVLIFFYLLGNGLVYSIWTLELEGVLAAWLVATGVALAVTLIPLLKGKRGQLRSNWRLFGRTAEVGGRGAVSAILIFLLFRSNIYLVKHFLGVDQLGVYMSAVVLAEMMQRLPNLAGLVLLPKVIRGHDDDDRLSLRVARYVLLFSLAAAAGVVLLGRPFIGLFAGSAYLAGYGPLVWMLPGLVFSGFGSVLNTKLAGQGYPPVTLWAPGLALAANVALNVWLIPQLGLKGAALSASVTYTLWALIVTVAYLRHTGLGWSAFLRARACGPTIEKSTSSREPTTSDDSHDGD